MAKSNLHIGSVSITKNDISLNLGEISLDCEVSLQEIVENGKQGFQVISQLREFARSELPDVIRNTMRAVTDAMLDAERYNKAHQERMRKERVNDAELDITLDNMKAAARKERDDKLRAEAKTRDEVQKAKEMAERSNAHMHDGPYGV